MMTSDGHIEFLRRNAVEIAACAYAGHKADGRGLVVVDVDRHDEATGTVPFQFTPERLLAKTIRPYYGTRAAEMVSQYLPEKEVVVAFIQTGENGGVDSFRVKSFPSPKTAFEIE
jgi:hypothetical protein